MNLVFHISKDSFVFCFVSFRFVVLCCVVS